MIPGGADDRLLAGLKKYFGYDDFLDNQRQVIGRIISGNDLCVVMPTGAGKSLCYQLPALLADGFTLVVSPLIALMLDQVQSLRRRGIPAAFINSTVSFAEQLAAADAAACGEIKLLYVAPERLQTGFFQDFLRRNPPEMLVVDEAHCISEWGHDFRPSYRRIGEAALAAGIKRVCAFTATATPLVCRDIRTQLQRENMELLVAGFRRPNLSFKVQMCDGGKAAKLAALKKLLAGEKVPTIIYAATRQAVDELTSALPGVTGYHAGMSLEARNLAQEYFMHDPAPVLAATNAFGMGIDRSDVRKVIHYQLPGSLEAYYQEAGRAGRDGESAECTLLFSFSDRYIQKFLIEMNNPPPEVIRGVYTAVRNKILAMETPAPLEISASALADDVPGVKSDGQISAALGILEKSGAIRRMARRSGHGTLRFTGDPDRLRILHQEERTQRSRFIHRVISKWGRAAGRETECTIEELAEIAGLSPDQVKRVIGALSGEVLEWHGGFTGRAIELTDPALITPELDDAELSRHLDYETARLDEVVHYARSANCRQVGLIGYFGEVCDNWECGCCDICAGTSSAAGISGVSESDIRTALRAADIFSGRIGIGKLGQILAGSRSASIIAGNWHRNPCFGTLRKLRAAKIERLLRALTDSGELARIDRNGYPCIVLSEKGRARLHNSGSMTE